MTEKNDYAINNIRLLTVILNEVKNLNITYSGIRELRIVKIEPMIIFHW